MFLVLISFCAAYDCIVLYSEFTTSKTELDNLVEDKKEIENKIQETDSLLENGTSNEMIEKAARKLWNVIEREK